MADDFAADLALAVALALKAGDEVMKLRGNAAVKKKDGGEPVTEADLAANRIILEGLESRIAAGDALLSEETPAENARLTARRVWIIDPIDGTREFIEGTDDFAIQIGLAVDGVPSVGVVYQCAKQRLYRAARGRGAFLDNPHTRATSKLVPSAVTDPHAMAMTISRWHRSKKHDVIARVVKAASIIPAGSIGVKVGLVAAGKADLYLHPSRRAAEWDTCGPAAIILEAGGMMTDFYGEALSYNQPDPHHPRGLAASNGRAAHAAVLALLAPVMPEFGFV